MNSLLNRRQFLGSTGQGLGGIALASLLAREGLLAKEDPIRPSINPAKPFAARPPHFAPAAKNVLVIFCSGACSQLDTFDYKPELIKRNGQPMPGAEELKTFQGAQGNLTKSPWKFKPRGQSGKMVSELVPQLGELADEMCFIHSLTGKTNTHGPGENFMSTGYTLDGFPSMGAWVTWALGSANDELPAYVAIPDPRGTPQSSVNNWGPGFLPAAFQGTDFNASNPLRNLARPAGVSARSDRATRNFLQRLNQRHLEKFPGDTELAARISSYELAARMQLSVPEVSDLSTEKASTLKAYGVDDGTNPIKAGFAKNCILARRLLEKGVRFVQIYDDGWDAHSKLKSNHSTRTKAVDKPIAGLIRDLKRRGLLEDTLVIWTGEFGFTPDNNKRGGVYSRGRGCGSHAMTMLLAGGGVKRGAIVGATDEIGAKAVDVAHPIRDLHVTLLHLLGLDDNKLTYFHAGRYKQLSQFGGQVIKELIA